MNWLDKLERRFGRRYIPNLISYLLAGQIVVYAVALFVNPTVTAALALTRSGLFKGQVWRVLTFLLVPISGDILSFAISAYFMWFIGSSLENAWGSFRFNVYVLCGVLGALAACLLTGYAGSYCLYMSMFLAFALLFPEVQVLLFFILPVKVKYLGWVAAGILLLSFVTVPLLAKLQYLLCMAGFFAFFGPELWHELRAWLRREQWKRKNRR